MLAMLVIGVAALGVQPPGRVSPASADAPKNCPSGICTVKAESDGDGGTQTTSSGTDSRGGPSAKDVARRQLAHYRKVMHRYEQQAARYQRCLNTQSLTARACVGPGPVAVLAPPDALVDLLGGPGVPTFTPDQAGAIAVARLRLPLSPPRVGPDPKVNKWKMAAVGYPLWIWADGPTHVGPVSDSVGGLSVSLQARLTKTVFRMGDGNIITCAGAGAPFRKGTAPATPSPDCGYRYEQPSLPEGDYTISAVAYWAVTWTVNGSSGVITVPRGASAALPVGEVQVLTR